MGGLAAGVLYNVGGMAAAAILNLQDAFVRLGLRPSPLVFLLHIGMRFGFGLLSVFVYSAIRPRFGPGPRTALIAGVIMWLSAQVPLVTIMAELGALTVMQALTGVLWGLGEAVAATLVGARLYREP